MRTTWFAVFLLTLAVTSGACATPPKADIDAAKAAVDKAVAARASQYAPESLRAAQDAQAKLDKELTFQDGHLPMMRSYDEAVTLAATVKMAGEKAEQDASRAELAESAEASALVVEANAVIQDVEAQIDKAPKGKRAPADLDALKSVLAGAKSGVGEAEAALASQHYSDAKAKAEAAKATAGSIASSLERADEAQQTAGARRR